MQLRCCAHIVIQNNLFNKFFLATLTVIQKSLRPSYNASTQIFLRHASSHLMRN